jgi:hypothetical protein
LLASSALTSLPSGATVALNCAPRPRLVEVVEFTDPPAVYGKEEFLLLTLLGVAGGREEEPTSIRVPLSARSTLLPARSSVRFGEARARASFRKEESVVKVWWEVMS